MNQNHSKRSALILACLLGVLSLLSSSQSNGAQVPRVPDGDLGGTVTAIEADQVKIKTIANEPFTIVFAADTAFFKQVGSSFKMVPAKVTDIHVGNSINVIGHLDPDGITKHAKNVMIVTAETSQKLLAHGGIGQSDVYGKVMAIGGTKLTIARPDKVSQMIEVNEQTAFLKGEPRAIVGALHGVSSTTSQAELETIKLADIKVGDTIFAKGALKFPATTAMNENIFVASKLAVQVVPSPPNADAGATPKR